MFLKSNYFLLFASLFLNCNYDIREGAVNDVIVVVSKVDKPYIYNFWNDTMNDTLWTPQPEKKINYIWVEPIEFNNYKNYSNIITISLKNPIDSIGNSLNNQFLKATGLFEPIQQIFDLYIKNQKIFIIDAFDLKHAFDLINNNEMWIKSEIDKNILSILKHHIKSKRENKDILLKINNFMDINIFIEEDYKIIKSDDESIWIGRGIPYRWIMLFNILNHEINNNTISNHKEFENSIWNEIEKKIILLTDGKVKISDYYKDIKNTTNHFTYSINGLYEHADSKSGGPLIGYIYPSNKDTSLCLLGFVNYPGHEKMNLLYQLSAIFNTIERGQNE